MPKPRTDIGGKNLIHSKLVTLRNKHGLSQRALAEQLQLRGWDIDKNVITRIETNKRYVSDLELKALAEFFRISYNELLDENDTNDQCPVKNDAE